MSYGSEQVSDFLAKANIKFTTPVSSYLLLSRAANGPQTDNQKQQATVIDHKNCSNLIDISKSLIATVEVCSHLCTTIDKESELKLLRFQSNKSQSIIITGKFLINSGNFFFFYNKLTKLKTRNTFY